MILCGIDPGLSGAIAWYWTGKFGLTAVEDLPVVSKEINAALLAASLRTCRPDHVFLELVSAMPKQGVSSTFRFGESYGAVKATLAVLGIPYTLVTPGKWKRALGLDADKEKSRALAIRTWPESDAFRRKKDHGRAEAALLALWGSKQ